MARRVLVIASVLCTVPVFAGCGSARGGTASSAPSTTGTAGLLAPFTGCSTGLPTVSFAGKETKLLILFKPGTTADQMDTVANSLLPLSQAGVASDVASGLTSVGEPVCNPPEVQVEYRSTLNADQLASLKERLLSQPGVLKITNSPAT